MIFAEEDKAHQTVTLEFRGTLLCGPTIRDDYSLHGTRLFMVNIIL